MSPEESKEYYLPFLKKVKGAIQTVPCNHVAIFSFPDDDSGVAVTCDFPHFDNLTETQRFSEVINYINAFSHAMLIASNGLVNVNDLVDRGVRDMQREQGEEETGLDFGDTTDIDPDGD